MRIPVTAVLLDLDGTLLDHDGAAHTAFVGACATWLRARGDGGNVVGVSNHTDFLRAVRDGTVDVRGTPIHRGRSQQLWLAEITDDQGRLVARGQVRLQNLSTAGGLGRS